MTVTRIATVSVEVRALLAASHRSVGLGDSRSTLSGPFLKAYMKALSAIVLLTSVEHF